MGRPGQDQEPAWAAWDLPSPSLMGEGALLRVWKHGAGVIGHDKLLPSRPFHFILSQACLTGQAGGPGRARQHCVHLLGYVCEQSNARLLGIPRSSLLSCVSSCVRGAWTIFVPRAVGPEALDGTSPGPRRSTLGGWEILFAFNRSDSSRPSM